VDVERLIRAARMALVERDLSDDTRATLGLIGGRRAIILNRRWPFRSEAERRWVLAEEVEDDLRARGPSVRRGALDALRGRAQGVGGADPTPAGSRPPRRRTACGPLRGGSGWLPRPWECGSESCGSC